MQEEIGVNIEDMQTPTPQAVLSALKTIPLDIVVTMLDDQQKKMFCVLAREVAYELNDKKPNKNIRQPLE